MFKRCLNLLVLSLLAAAAAYSIETPDSARQRIHAVRIEGDLDLHGTLSDARWSLASPVEIRYEVSPGENTPAPQMTRVRVLYNSDYVYFGFDCRDTNASSIRAHITDRDKVFDDDFVGIILDTYGDYQRAYEFLVNPYGIQADLMRVGSNEDDSFDTVWKTSASINDSGWCAIIAVPFKSLRFPAAQEQHWVALFFRNLPRLSRQQMSWTPYDRNNPCFLCQGGLLEGIAGVQSTNSVELLPYIVGQQRGGLLDESDPSSPFQNGKLKGRVGGGIRYSPTPDMSVEAVVNPDFSQVESDATQISVNSTFALNYPEKRPFFLYGADLFQNNTGTFYSRTINNPLGAARVMGKTGSFSFGYLAASDRNTPYIVPGEENSDFVSTNVSSFSNIARARYDFGNERFIGAAITTRNAADAHNYVGGIDWNYRFWDNYDFNGEVFYSDTKELNDSTLLSNSRGFGGTGFDAAFNGEHYGGAAYLFGIRRDGRDYSIGLQYMDRAPTFQAQNGFVPNNDTRMLFLQQQYTFYTNNSFLDAWSIQGNAGLHFNHEDVRKEKWFVPGITLQLKNQVNATVTYFLLNDELFGGVQFNNINRTQIDITAKPSSILTLIFDGSFGRFIRRSSDPDMGTGHNISLTATLRPTSRFQMDLSFSRARLSSVASGELFYDGYIARAMGIYQFTSEIFLRVIGQYDQFNKAADLYPLLSYKLNPFTIFYAGSTYSLTDFDSTYGVKQTSRQYFLKLQYLLRS
ncbi:MAG TPA: sugar-binding protein [Bacteroidota bacterium]|nr:sugar-binding protein [Bacteroidota bacterium]